MEQVRISPSVEFFAWSYPIQEDEDQDQDKDKDKDKDKLLVDTTNSPELAFLTVGGFVYFDKNKQVLQVAGLVQRPHGVLKFGDRIELEQSQLPRHETRFQEITLKALLDQGANKFCWVNPGERLKDDTKNEHGGFAYYMFKEAATIYFPLELT